ncbi:MAG: CoA transferase, partial [Acidimicrobiales bacterium]
MGLLDRWFDEDRAESDGDAWSRSGAMALTGDWAGPVWRAEGDGPGRLVAAARALEVLSTRRGHPVVVDGCALLGERAALGGLQRQGSRSVGGLAEMVSASDGWVAINLARPADVDLLGALVGRPVDPGDWPTVAAAIAAVSAADLVARATDLGLPLARVPDVVPEVAGPAEVMVGGGRPVPSAPLVVELAGLWAGPLCGDLLARAGCRVIKLETRQRPDGARRGNPRFFDLLNGGKESVVVDLDSVHDRTALGHLLDTADVVVDGSRARVMAPWGVDVDQPVAGGTVWVSITG